jgi:hypothetical protein
MTEKQFLLSTEQISQETAYYTMGFAHLTRDRNIEDATSAGSGTFVRIGSLHGVLTAAHVLENLPTYGTVGVVLQAQTPQEFQRQTIIMEHTQRVAISNNEFGEYGPDLAFLRLVDADIGWLKAKISFYNLMKRRDDVLAGKRPSKSHADVITGAIHEFTKDAPPQLPRTRKKVFALIFCSARQTAVRYMDDRQLTYFEPVNDPGFPMPTSFEGTSGGAIWCFYVAEKDNKPEVIERWLIGVPFFQSPGADGKYSITCHGERDIYGRLIDRVVAQWPVEANAATR